MSVHRASPTAQPASAPETRSDRADHALDAIALDDLRARILAEAKDIERDCRIAVRCHSRAATFWLAVYYVLGLPTTVLAALAGVSAVTDHPVWATALAVAAAIVAATNTFLNAGQMAQAHSKKRSEYEHLKNDVRHFTNITLAVQWPVWKDLVGGLFRLSEARDTLNVESPQVRRGAYERAELEQAEWERQKQRAHAAKGGSEELSNER